MFHKSLIKILKTNINSNIYNKKFYSTTSSISSNLLNTPTTNVDLGIPPVNNSSILSSNSTTEVKVNEQQQEQQQAQQQVIKGNCWCMLKCKLQDKRIESSKVKPITYESSKGWVLGDYNANYEAPLTKNRKHLISALIKEKDIFILEEQQDKINEEKKLVRDEEEPDESEIEKQEKSQTKLIFQSQEEQEEANREYPVLNDDTTSLGPVHVLYKNEWIITVVERIELDHKDNEPWFTLKLKTPIRQKDTYHCTFNIESVDLLEKLFAFNKSISIDKEFDKLFLTKCTGQENKEGTKALMESRPYLRESLMSLKCHLLPSIGFENSDINLELLKDDEVICKQGNRHLEFPKGTFQLCLEITGDESIWKKNPETIEKILYLYTVMLDSIVSTGQTVDSPLDTCYL
ncbi:hypothetical protein DLAC_01504 [Tieghemostelium lacteum]|uniref:Uncharacterized protein n=1 Tax=Tieghemostelium lacteum TaxID=361077 RepID=A0A152A5Y0_TIELA|nr:hypothetical protein DLAC_01504 [Tieghemostelium lacteum]|eukprot:KYR01515.1 hypothetical protein DLAC_01504 [Tieghemostelium lacteum]